MSNIGKEKIYIPKDVEYTYKKNETDISLNVKGQFGELNISLPKGRSIVKEENTIKISAENKKLHGVTRTQVLNAFLGVSKGFHQSLNIIGVGYRVSLEDENTLRLKIGFSHDVVFSLPPGIKVICPKPDSIVLFGIKKDYLLKTAASIRNLKRPDAYKGKGIRFENEILRLKEGKKK